MSIVYLPDTRWKKGPPPGGKGSVSMTEVQFIENNDGAFTFFTGGADLHSCTFKDNRPYSWDGDKSSPPGGDICMGRDSTLTAENCIFTHTLSRSGSKMADGQVLRCFGTSASFTNCYFATEIQPQATMYFAHYSSSPGGAPDNTITVTFNRCSFEGPGIQLMEKDAEGKVTVNIVIEECLSFSGKDQGAVASGVSFDEALVSYNGGACFWWPSSEEEGGGEEEMSPSPSDVEEGEVDTGASESEVNPGVDEDSETSSSLKDDVIPGEDNDGKSPPKKGLSDGEIAAAVVVPLAVVIGVAVLIVFFLWRRKRMENTSLSPQGTVETAQETGSSGV